jgi:hypothetical protein
VAPASQCFEKRDLQIQSAIDENHSRRTSSSLLVISSPGSSSISLTFRNLNISSSSNVTHAYLQLLCANAFLGNMTYEMQMRDPLSGYESQRAFYSTKVTEDLSGELWLSSNMSHLLMDIVSSSNALFIQDIELTMTAVGDIRHAYSFTSSPHLAPSLYVQMTNSGHC